MEKLKKRFVQQSYRSDDLDFLNRAAQARGIAIETGLLQGVGMRRLRL